MVFGVEHPDSLSTRHGLAHWTGSAGDAVGARDRFTVLVHIYERVLGVEHPDTLAARRSLADGPATRATSQERAIYRQSFCLSMGESSASSTPTH